MSQSGEFNFGSGPIPPQVATSYVTNSGTAIPAANILNVLGANNLSFSGAGNTVTGHILSSAIVGQILQSQGVGVDAAYSTATYPSTTTINQLLYSSSANVVGGVTAANSAVLLSSSTGVPGWSGTLTNGQIIIGNTGNTPSSSTLTAGTGVSITNGAGTITINAVGGGVTWSETSGAFSAVANHGYFLTGASTPTMPASPTEGDTIEFSCDTSSTVTVTANTGQTLRIGSAVSASAGTAASSTQGNSVRFVYKSTGTVWIAQSVIGTWTVT